MCKIGVDGSCFGRRCCLWCRVYMYWWNAMWYCVSPGSMSRTKILNLTWLTPLREPYVWFLTCWFLDTLLVATPWWNHILVCSPILSWWFPKFPLLISSQESDGSTRVHFMLTSYNTIVSKLWYFNVSLTCIFFYFRLSSFNPLMSKILNHKLSSQWNCCNPSPYMHIFWG